MSPKQYFLAMTGVLGILVLLIIGGTVGGNMILQKKSEELVSLKAKDKTIENQQTALIQAKKDVEKYQDLEKIAKSVVPQDKDQARTVREIVKIAEDNRVPIKSVTFPSSTLGDVAAKPAPAASGTEGGSAPAPAPKVAPSQLKAVEGIAGVYTLELQIVSENTVFYQDFLRFLEALEKNRRTAHVTAVNLNPNKDNARYVEFQLTLNAYVKP